MRRRYPFAIALVGENSLRKEGLARILNSENFVLASIDDADDWPSDEALQNVPASQALFLIVHSGDDFRSTVGQIDSFKRRCADARVAVVADHFHLSDLVAAFRAGATGYFIDVMNCDAFIKSIELVMMGGTVFPPAFLTSALDSEKRDVDDAPVPNDDDRAVATADDTLAQQLSPREVSIVQCLIEGDSNKCIARKIKIAEATVKVHIKAILRKIRVQNRTQAAIWGLNHRSAAWSRNSSSAHQVVDVTERLLPPGREISKIARAGRPVPLGAIDHAENYFEASLANGHTRKDMSSKVDGAIRLRK
ncbi:DNA-binding NarL/FixJ family response regulator [Bradyrhizobium japonicum]|jgi:DNA-binding NarL/FixJ family response regulator|uniref:DNA-binding NarL/FixJ family response regulator n=1 Tax=Bradyrhizobium elkanii TaxID=29448 RepID=A0A1E3EJ60_BRAEL|nr:MULTISPECIES: response regulator transcription factor [Bradyrhizobium]MBP1292003.1 two-component system nitrate/nitrite response regulator NarL [Bradyrhizobium elkanii]MBP2430322.1 two-component system nitrate/nitrite response regulator NarL [Bradyrhizobium elkanii]MCP1736338.1 two-component system nitrate/nitrite response regulator NarL [Bradyrhizobium elkanii]MCP1754234.1 two-component system nitrate/nitrite response regulator NarL [Bradyrhizobium elkanii]MCP1927558.1 two-component system